LAYRAAYSSIYQNFCVEDYLSSKPQRTSILIGSSSNQSYVWWLRSGSPSYCARESVVYPSGEFDVVVSDGFYSNGVRPAMVIKIT
ncbi:MAG: hypothetical protein IKV69_02420, partial [Clostridia bacterium]|nr:hypothetical protein [Clostridia bacterium]